jgi:hypothetical protein
VSVGRGGTARLWHSSWISGCTPIEHCTQPLLVGIEEKSKSERTTEYELDKRITEDGLDTADA